MSATLDNFTGCMIGLAVGDAVVTAIACFANAPDSYSEVVSRAIGQGNDTDTLAAMAGALSGAHVGLAGIPHHLVCSLEDRNKGRSYIEYLAERLFFAHSEWQAGRSEDEG